MRFLRASSHFHGFRYAASSADNRFPVAKSPLPTGLVLKPGDSPLIDCSSFITALAVYGWPGIEWDGDAYSDMQIFSVDNLWSPVHAWERHGLGKRTEAPANGWGFYQSWIDDQFADVDGDGISGGHQWAYSHKLQLRLHSTIKKSAGPTMDRGVTWDSLEKYYKAGIRGVELK